MLSPSNEKCAFWRFLPCCSFGLLCYSLSSTQNPDPDNHQASCHSSSLWNVWKPLVDFTRKKKKRERKENGTALFVTFWHQLKRTPVWNYVSDWLGGYVIRITVWNTATKNTVGDRKGTYRFDFGWFRPEAALCYCRGGSAATHDSFTLFHSGCCCDILPFHSKPRKLCTHITN